MHYMHIYVQVSLTGWMPLSPRRNRLRKVLRAVDPQFEALVLGFEVLGFRVQGSGFQVSGFRV